MTILYHIVSSRFPPNLLTGTAHTYTVHKTNTDACSFTGQKSLKDSIVIVHMSGIMG